MSAARRSYPVPPGLIGELRRQVDANSEGGNSPTVPYPERPMRRTRRLIAEQEEEPHLEAEAIGRLLTPLCEISGDFAGAKIQLARAVRSTNRVEETIWSGVRAIVVALALIALGIWAAVGVAVWTLVNQGVIYV